MINNILIKILGFFIGFFITIIVINYIYIDNNKNKSIQDLIKIPNYYHIPTIETFDNNTIKTEPKTETEMNDNNQLIPYKEYKFMCITTFYDIKQISNSQGKWFECEYKTTNANANANTNTNSYFTYDKNINLKSNSINDKGAYGADISSVQLNGPRCYNFANNMNTSELYEFSMLLTVKIKEITEKNNIIFEMIGNSNEYKISIVHINLQLNENKNIDVILQIGDVIYNGLINNIDINIIKSGDFIVIGLIYSKKEVKFMLNKQVYKYENKNTFDITLGSTPLIINKKGIIDMELYNFIYYKSIIPSKEYLNYFKHVYYYLSGLHTAISSPVPSSPVPSPVSSSPVPSSSVPSPVLNDNNNENYKKFKTKLEELEYNIQQNLNKKQIDTNIDEIKPFKLI